MFFFRERYTYSYHSNNAELTMNALFAFLISYLFTFQLRMTPLHWAVESGDCNSVELLLRHGADIHIENKFDKSPLEIASDKGNTDIYQMLLNAENYRIQADSIAESEIATRAITSELNNHQQVRSYFCGFDVIFSVLNFQILNFSVRPNRNHHSTSNS